jgi:predicted DCC family thiol-disulfide oxidoreductase YuxK
MLPEEAHTSRPWRIHEITPDFRLEDVWALPTPGGPDEFPRLIGQFASADPSRSLPGAARALWSLRWKIGELLGWDDEDGGLGSRVGTLRDRLPEDLLSATPGPGFDSLPFSSLYLLEDEWAAEIANRTMHGVIHLGWVPEADGCYRGQMAVLVKPNGLLGDVYMAAIRPFRHLIVYPTLMRLIERRWAAQAGDWVVLYDADCDFCKWLLAKLLRRDRAGRLRPIALQRTEAIELLSDLAPAERMASWHLIPPGGERLSAGAALAALLRLLPSGRFPAVACERFPGLAERAYRWVSEHRSQLSSCVPERSKLRSGELVRQRERAFSGSAWSPPNRGGWPARGPG